MGLGRRRLLLLWLSSALMLDCGESNRAGQDMRETSINRSFYLFIMLVGGLMAGVVEE